LPKSRERGAKTMNNQEKNTKQQQNNHKNTKLNRQADVLDQTRLRALILFLYTAII
jgi:hypothetical protein